MVGVGLFVAVVFLRKQYCALFTHFRSGSTQISLETVVILKETKDTIIDAVENKKTFKAH